MKIFEPMINFFKRKKIINNYCSFNKKLFKDKIRSNNNEILIEFNAFQINQVGLAAISNILAKKFDAKISGYVGFSFFVTPLKFNLIQSVKWTIGNFFNLKTFKIYRSFNTKKIFKPEINKEIHIEADKLFKKMWPKIHKKEDILKVKLHGIYFGDLIYDTYIKANYIPTIDIKDLKFKDYFYDYLTLFLFWYYYFKRHNVKAIIGSHPVYSYVLPLRIAARKNILAYVLDIEHLFKVTKKNLYQLSDCKDYKKISNSLKKSDLIKGKLEAKKRLGYRFSGAESVNMDYPDLQKSSFHKNLNKEIIKKTKRKKILICAHEFFDAPHIYGRNFFSDFYEWMEYLGKLSNETPYDWYIKNHVNQPGKYKIYQPLTTKILNDFVKRYKNIKILPNNYSHKQILKEKVDFVLTVYGSIAYEYPLFGIPVINATKNHPQRMYNFSITPKSKKQYGYMLKNLEKLKYKIKKDEVYEYYYIRFIYNASFNWLIDYKKVLKKFKNWSNIYNFEFYKYYVDSFDQKKFEYNSKKYLEYVNSNQYRLRESLLKLK
jgi:hypothetical protein